MAPIKRTYFPGFAKLSHDLPALRDVFLKAYGLVILLALPATVGIGMTADLFVPLALGENWLDTIPIIEILIFAALLTALQGPVRPILLALNRPNIVAYITLINAIFLISFLIAGAWLAGLAGAAWGVVGARFFVTVIEYCVLYRILQVSIWMLSRKIARIIISCAAMALAVWGLEQAVDFGPAATIPEQLLILALVSLGGATTYAFSLCLLWTLSGKPMNSTEGEVLQFLKMKLQRSRLQSGLDRRKCEPTDSLASRISSCGPRTIFRRGETLVNYRPRPLNLSMTILLCVRRWSSVGIAVFIPSLRTSISIARHA